MSKIQASFRNISITPNFKVSLGCNGISGDKSYEKIDCPLEINAILFTEQKENYLFLSIDTLYVTDDILSFVLKHLKKKHNNIKSENIFLGASHTHYAPFLDKSKPKLGKVDSRYMTFFYLQLEKLLDQILSTEAKEVLINFQTKKNSFNINRRKKAWILRRNFFPWRHMRIHPNLKGVVDSNIYSLSILSAIDGKVLAFVWVYACHPVMYHSPENLTSHFPGEIRKKLRNTLKAQSLPCLFFQGFSGNTRPRILFKPKLLKEKFFHLINGVRFANFNQESYEIWTQGLYKDVKFLLENPILLKQINFKPKRLKIPLNAILRDASGILSIQAFYLNSSTLILGLSAEVCAEYKEIISKIIPSCTIIPAGCIGQTYGYLPTKPMIKNKGYESHNFLKGFSFNNSKFTPYFDKILMSKCKEISK